MTLRLLAAAQSDIGREREENEDYLWAQVFIPPQGAPLGLFLVCDGMGGHMGGKYASYWAVEAVRREFAPWFIERDPRDTLTLSKEQIARVRAGERPPFDHMPPLDLEALTRRAVQKANEVVYHYALHRPEKAANAGSTLAMLAVHGEQAMVANVGDSRVYRLRDRNWVQLTRDHSLVADLVAEGFLTRQAMITHPDRNLIYRYLGQKSSVQADFFPETPQPGDIFLLCTDGLWEMFRDEGEMVAIIERATSLEQACQDLIQAANEAGGEDNISVILVRVE